MQMGRKHVCTASMPSVVACKLFALSLSLSLSLFIYIHTYISISISISKYNCVQCAHKFSSFPALYPPQGRVACVGRCHLTCTTERSTRDWEGREDFRELAEVSQPLHSTVENVHPPAQLLYIFLFIADKCIYINKYIYITKLIYLFIYLLNIYIYWSIHIYIYIFI